MSAAELIETVRSMSTEEKRAFVERLREEFGEELGWVKPEPIAQPDAEPDRRMEGAVERPQPCRPLEDVVADLESRFGVTQ